MSRPLAEPVLFSKRGGSALRAGFAIRRDFDEKYVDFGLWVGVIFMAGMTRLVFFRGDPLGVGDRIAGGGMTVPLFVCAVPGRGANRWPTGETQ